MSVTENRQIGRRIASVRHERGVSQREIDQAGVSYAYLSRLEAGTRNASWSALIKIANKLGTTALFLKYGPKSDRMRCPVCERKP